MKNSHITIGVLALVLIVGGVLVASSFNSSKPDDQKSPKPSMVKDDSSKQSMKGQNESAAVSERYVEYSEASFAKATENDGNAVLFFAALAWCPSCQAADKDIKTNIGKVPNNITILRVDYDIAKELKQKYAITMQDTFIQVGSDGKEVARWNSGGQGVQALLANSK